jgi:hypothetical protein
MDHGLPSPGSSLFIDEYFTSLTKAPSALVKTGSSTKNLWHDGKKADKAPSPAWTYGKWIRDLYDEHAPEKSEGVKGLLKKSKGKEYSLYTRACAKYGVEPKPEYIPPPPGDEMMWKYDAAAEALVLAAKLHEKEGVQWAQTGVEGKRQFADFNKLMSSGGTMENMSMGGDVGTRLGACAAHLAEEHDGELATAVAHSEKPFSSGLHKTFCKVHGHCGKPAAKKADNEL